MADAALLHSPIPTSLRLCGRVEAACRGAPAALRSRASESKDPSAPRRETSRGSDAIGAVEPPLSIPSRFVLSRCSAPLRLVVAGSRAAGPGLPVPI